VHAPCYSMQACSSWSYWRKTPMERSTSLATYMFLFIKLIRWWRHAYFIHMQ
jgi:hypothetical protein